MGVLLNECLVMSVLLMSVYHECLIMDVWLWVFCYGCFVIQCGYLQVECISVYCFGSWVL